MLHQIPLLLLFSAIFMMPLRVSGMVGEEGHRTSSDPHDEHGRRASPPGSAQNDNSARDTGARSGTAEHPGVDEANPPQQPPANPEAVIQFLRDSLDHNPTAGRFTINTEGHLLGAEPLDRDTVIRPNQGRGTMDRLRGILRDVGLGELNDQGILRDQLPNQERLRIGEDLLTRVRVEAIITLIENHVDPFRDVLDRRDFSEQDQCELTLRKLRGYDFVKYDGSSVEFNTDHVDGLMILENITKGRMEFPLHHLELSDYSLMELLSALVAALGHNMDVIDEQIDAFKTAKENPDSLNLQKEISVLENYKQSIEIAKGILRSKNDQKEEEEGDSIDVVISILRSVVSDPEKGKESIGEAINSLQSITGQREVNSVFAMIKKLHACFSLHSQALEENIEKESIEGALHILQEIKDQRGEGNSCFALIKTFNKSFSLLTDPVRDLAAGDHYCYEEIETIKGVINILQEIKDQREVNSVLEIIKKLHAGFFLHSQSLEALAAGDGGGCDNMNTFARQAIAALAVKNPRLAEQYLCDELARIAECLNKEAAARMLATEEQAKDNPNQQTIANYEHISELFRQAREAGAKRHELHSKYLQHQAEARMLLTEEQAKDNPNQQTITNYKYISELFRQAGTAQAEGRQHYTVKAKYLNRQAEALMRATEEDARGRNARLLISFKYKKISGLFRQAVDLLAKSEYPSTSDYEKAKYLNCQAEALMRATEEEARHNPKWAIVAEYKIISQLFEKIAQTSYWKQKDFFHQAEVLMQATEEQAMKNPDQTIINMYKQSAYFYGQAAVSRIHPNDLRSCCDSTAARFATQAYHLKRQADDRRNNRRM